MKRSSALIVDDNRDLAENLREILADIEDADIECAVATDGHAAVELASRIDLDLALIDLHLPDARGTDLVGRIRENAPFAQIVIITGDATAESAINAVRAGAFAYVLKPFRAPELIETARRAIAQAQLFREREDLRAELERSERRHREVVEAMPAFVLVLDDSGAIVLWNRSLEVATGYSRAEMTGKPGVDLVGDAEGDRRLPLKDGGHRIVRWQVTRFGGAQTYAMGVDVTDEREAERRSRRAERLAAVGTLAAGLAHEVRNPLNSALLQLQVLERRIDKGQREPEALLSVTGVVKDEIRRLDRLVSDFLAFAQPRPLQLKHTFINLLVESVVELVRPDVQERGIELRVELDPHAGYAQVEPERMRQVFLNLIRNGMEAMGGSGVLTVRTRGPDHVGNVVVEIEDTGHGFAEDAPIFDAFFTTKESGTGLGLAIVHRIVTEHDGTIRVQSAPGRTCFAVSLPQEPSAPSDSSPA